VGVARQRGSRVVVNLPPSDPFQNQFHRTIVYNMAMNLANLNRSMTFHVVHDTHETNYPARPEENLWCIVRCACAC